MEQLESKIVSEPEAIKILQSENGLTHLKPFYVKAKSLSEAASEIGVSISAYSYWLKKFISSELVFVSHIEERAGSKIKFYKTSAKVLVANIGRNIEFTNKYFQLAIDEYNSGLPAALSSFATTWKNDFGISSFVNERGELALSIGLITKDDEVVSILSETLKPTRPAVYAIWKELQLKYEDAKGLQRKMDELIQEYEKKSVLKQQSYRIQMIMIPENKQMK